MNRYRHVHPSALRPHPSNIQPPFLRALDPMRRAEAPLAIDEELAEEERTDGLLLGDRPVPLSPEAEHLGETVDERIDEELYGTTDVQHAIQDATSWIPPESPTPEGLGEGTN